MELNSFVLSVINSSPVYNEFYKNVGKDDLEFQNLPIITWQKYWELNFQKVSKEYSGKEGGFIFKSSGTLGDPKNCFFSKKEWVNFARKVGNSFKKNAISDSDVIANLALSGKMASSFLTVHDAILVSDLECLELTLTRDASIEYIVLSMVQHKVSIAIGFPLTMIAIADYCLENNIQIPSLKKFMCGGEVMRFSQKEFISKAFPNIIFAGTIYASNEGGLIGYWTPECQNDEIEVAEDFVKVEIYRKEADSFIKHDYAVGDIVITCLKKEKTPIIRYLTGDKGQWVTKLNGKRYLRLMGRESVLNIKDAGVVLNETQMEALVKKSTQDNDLLGMTISQDESGRIVNFILMLPSFTKKYEGELVIESLKDALLTTYPNLNDFGLKFEIATPQDMINKTEAKMGFIKNSKV